MERFWAKRMMPSAMPSNRFRKNGGSNFAKVFETPTVDNESEFIDLGTILKNEEIDVYFTHPYTFCEQGQTNVITDELDTLFLKVSLFSLLQTRHSHYGVSLGIRPVEQYLHFLEWLSCPPSDGVS